MTATALRALPPELECVEDGRRAATLLQHPLRLRILRLAAEPASASSIARALGLPRQKVNYHLRELARARFVRRAGDVKRRNMVERRFVAAARSFVLAPAGLVTATTGKRGAADRASAGYLVTLAGRAQAEAAKAASDSARRGARVATLAMEAAVRFESAPQRARFAAALERAVADLIARHASPLERPGGKPAKGFPFRLTILCHPIPGGAAAPSQEGATSS